MAAGWGRAGKRIHEHPGMRLAAVFVIGAAIPVVLLSLIAYAIDWAQ